MALNVGCYRASSAELSQFDAATMPRRCYLGVAEPLGLPVGLFEGMVRHCSGRRIAFKPGYVPRGDEKWILHAATRARPISEQISCGVIRAVVGYASINQRRPCALLTGNDRAIAVQTAHHADLNRHIPKRRVRLLSSSATVT